MDWIDGITRNDAFARRSYFVCAFPLSHYETQLRVCTAKRKKTQVQTEEYMGWKWKTHAHAHTHMLNTMKSGVGNFLELNEIVTKHKHTKHNRQSNSFH